MAGEPAAERGRVFLAACAAAIAFPLGYALPAYGKLTNLYYDPLARRWLLGVRPGAVPMGYLGQILWGTACAVIAAGAAWLLARRRPLADAAFTLGALWALTAFVLVGAYFTWNNWP